MYLTNKCNLGQFIFFRYYKKSLPWLIVCITAITVLFGLQNRKRSISKRVPEIIYLERIEYIDPNNSEQLIEFSICDSNNISQYYNPEGTSYKGEKVNLKSIIKKKYINKNYKDSGYLNIRFIVNCHGFAGNYLIHENDLNLSPYKLNEGMVKQLLEITKTLQNWNPNIIGGKNYDSYMYISYRIENGEITEILP